MDISRSYRKKMDVSRKYEDFLEFRRQENSNFLWVSRTLHPQVAYIQETPPTPSLHKHEVLHSPKIQELLEKLSIAQNVPKTYFEKQVKEILDEIGYNKSIKIIRWLGMVLTKICLKVSSGIYINGNKVQQIRSMMGNCPVIFVPSHRSYADFILMSYMCFTYEIAIPAIAAGMDFQGMWGMGTMLRDTGAFFMRRSYNDDSLYWTVFKQYIYQLMTRGDLPLEFFIEGTRSRSNKSLMPKFGLISMILKPFFFAQVPDVLFVPVSISYDRILEENLFAYELLGVPKPKETTSGFFKSLKILKEHFGSIFFHIGEPISSKEFFGNSIDRSIHNIAPLHKQELTEQEKSAIPPLAFEILNKQQQGFVLTIFNLVALTLNNTYTNKDKLPNILELKHKVQWLKGVMESLGAYIHCDDVERGIRECLVVHRNLICFNSDNEVCLVENQIQQGKINTVKLKAHQLTDQVMTYSVPFVELQLYVNPTLFHIVNLAILLAVIQKEGILNKEDLWDRYHFLRSLYAMEFVIPAQMEHTVFESALEHAIALNILRLAANKYDLGTNEELQNLLHNSFKPFLVSYSTVMLVLQNSPQTCEQKTILANVQRLLEDAINDREEFVHPYTLNLDTLNNCLNSLCAMLILKKIIRENVLSFEIDKRQLDVIKRRLGVRKYVRSSHK
ncbi:unnamed protein product [Callosobruchus maculatus]|uniref:Phospholipid/glycerol acyltransferase domain-containing protein n=1 Tax=Callosobruchus maculatus TaxID=64391 RepID=A0A653DHI6_CALMS|nr:unnamed protein product [Callosobruchus maculatus]